MIYFAPLQGYTEAFYRRAHNAIIGGVDEYVTPFLRLEKNMGSAARTFVILRIRCRRGTHTVFHAPL